MRRSVLHPGVKYESYILCVWNTDTFAGRGRSPLPGWNRDLISLVTCTPYGVNTHRLIVTGERVSDADVKKVDVPVETADWNGSAWMRAYLNAILAGSAMMAGLAVVVKVLSMFWKKGRKKCWKDKKRAEVAQKWKHWCGAALLLAGCLIFFLQSASAISGQTNTERNRRVSHAVRTRGKIGFIWKDTTV